MLHSLIAIGLALLSLAARPAWAEPGPDTHPASPTTFTNWKGRKIRTIQVLGVERTADKAIKGLLGGIEGLPFDPKEWSRGIRSLYNTRVLYGIETKIEDAGEEGIDIQLRLKDRWSLIPIFDAAGTTGGGYFRLGLTDLNLGGYFTEVSATMGMLNRYLIFDFWGGHQFFLNTPLIFNVGVNRSAYSTAFYDRNGTKIDSVDWARTRASFFFGLRHDLLVRAGLAAVLYQDAVLLSPSVLSSDKIRPQEGLRLVFEPRLTVGWSNLTDAQEEGLEWRLSGQLGDVGLASMFTSITATVKMAAIIGTRNNLALRSRMSWASPRRLNEALSLGGLDSVRGYPGSRLLGRSELTLNGEWRFMAFHIPMNFLIDLDRLAVQFVGFTDLGLMESPDSLRELGDIRYAEIYGLWSAGLGIRLNILRLAGSVLRLDFAHTLVPLEGWAFIFGFNQFF